LSAVSTNPDLLKVKADLAEALHQKAILEAREDFYVFVKLLANLMLDGNEYRDGRHIQAICASLENTEEGQLMRLMLSLPPGSMKSVLLMMFAAWCLGRHPTWRIMWISHTTDKAEDCSSRVRDLVRLEEYQEIFPHVSLREDKQGVTHWKLTQGGSFLPAGAGKSIAGYRFNLGIIDDPLSEQTAGSDTEREKINIWYGRGFRSRKLPKSIIILCATRWHVRDLNGYLLDVAARNPRADQWEYITIPAILDPPAADYLALPVGTTYWPEYITEEDLALTRESLDKAAWNSLYLQSPVGESGLIFQKELFREWEEAEPPHCDEIIISMDTAFSVRTTADFSSIQIWGIFYENEENEDGETVTVPNAILINRLKGRWTYPQLRKNALEQYKKYKPDKVIVENKASGQSLIQDLRLNNLPVLPFQPDRDKVARANATTGVLERGRVWLPIKLKFAAEVLQEALEFPKGAHDDDVDAMVMALLYLRRLHELTQQEVTKPELPKGRRRNSYWGVLNARRAA
jgi:predicted phage terminase large subunit-like protein